MIARFRSMSLAACLAVLVLSFEVGAQDEVRTVSSDDGAYTLPLPATWKTRRDSEDGAELVVSASLADRPSQTCRIALYWIESQRDARAHAYFDRASKRDSYGTDEVEVRLEPIPHLVVLHQDEESEEHRLEVFVYRMMAGRGLTLHGSMSDKREADFMPGLLAGMAGLTTKRKPWPPVPEGYTATMRDGIRYLTQKIYKGDADAFHREVARRQKDFARQHGATPKAPGRTPPSIVLHRIPLDAATLAPFVAESEIEYHYDPTRRWLFALDLPSSKDDDAPERLAAFARELTELLYVERFGNLQPDWYSRGLAEIAAESAATGKKLPGVTPKRLARLEDVPTRGLEDLYDAFGEIDYDEKSRDCLAYAVLFRIGPGKWKSAFTKFAKEFRKTGDWDAATKAHLLSLDDADLRAAAAKALQKLKPVKQKRPRR